MQIVPAPVEGLAEPEREPRAPDAPAWLSGITGYTFIDNVQAVSSHGLVITSLCLTPHGGPGWGVIGEDNETQLLVVRATTLPAAWQKFFREFEKMGLCKDCQRPVRNVPENPCSPCRSCQAMFALTAMKLCSVCHDLNVKHYTLLCGHSACRTCLAQWDRHTCPECRAPYKMNPGWREVKQVSEDEE